MAGPRDDRARLRLGGRNRDPGLYDLRYPSAPARRDRPPQSQPGRLDLAFRAPADAGSRFRDGRAWQSDNLAILYWRRWRRLNRLSPASRLPSARTDKWELFDLSRDDAQAVDLGDEEPGRLEALKALFLEQAKDNDVFPIGAALWTRLHPEDRVKSPYTHWRLDGDTTRFPEFVAPGLGAGKATGSSLTPNSARTPRASSMLWAAPAAASRATWTKGGSSTNTI